MHHTVDLASSDASSHNRNSSDSTTPRPDPTHSNPAQQPGGQLLTSAELNVSNQIRFKSTPKHTPLTLSSSSAPPTQLCSNLNIPATRYITLKTILLSGFVSSSSSSGPAGYIEKATRNFLTKAGWLGAA